MTFKPIVYDYRQNSPSTAFDSWDEIDTNLKQATKYTNDKHESKE